MTFGLASAAIAEDPNQPLRLRKRFDKLQNEEEVLRRVKMREQFRAQVENKRRAERASKVQILRSYRKGELPDVQVEIHALLRRHFRVFADVCSKG